MSKTKLKSVLTSKNEQEIERISNEMAVYFEARINASQLAHWIATANEHCLNYNDGHDLLKITKEAASFVNLIALLILPGFIECVNKEERIKYLIITIPLVFENSYYQGSKEALKQLGICFLDCYVKYIDEEHTVPEFMSIYTDFLYLCKMFKGYEAFSNALFKENKKEAA